MNCCWERNRYHFSLFADMQRHRCPAAMAEPVIFRLMGLDNLRVGSASSRKSVPSSKWRKAVEHEGLVHLATITARHPRQ